MAESWKIWVASPSLLQFSGRMMNDCGSFAALKSDGLILEGLVAQAVDRPETPASISPWIRPSPVLGHPHCGVR